MREVYLDHAATTYLLPAVKKVMDQYAEKYYGNPSALYTQALIAKRAVDQARSSMAKIFHCQDREIIFTGSGTESDNLALQGVARALPVGEIIVSSIEHPAVLDTAKYLATQGWNIIRAPVDRDGLVLVDKLRTLVNKNTRLVSVMYANNEIGTIQPIASLVKLVKKINPHTLFHTDACQASPYLDLDINKLGVDLLTLNGSKVYGPKGVGLLFIKKGTPIKPLIFGGRQEFGLRSGTENVAGIVGLATALMLAQKNQQKESARLLKLREVLINGIIKKIKRVRINGHRTKRLPNNINMTFIDIEGEAILLYLNQYGIMANTGSACASHSLDVSHVLQAIGLPYELIHGSIRFTLGQRNTLADINYVLRVLPKIIQELRNISPVHLNNSQPHPQIKK
ncbi:MAG: cysteine desulfurase NifS [Candidatus Komeilibacteria bacterium CG_4_10_14_0_2_um_filter_37_10]|uniref:Cysteine desulfurase NifS n=1 Tax=Candidatus Komeilibacteria bacterium CG_4_10_14_0_2_um_filter_37_10 TaxID=1974470 RepID=A0A2M7VFZ9_9BACT|nr:MAG: cysteine desulfurase NifS [Candidatus Komeilibacteria bacterium CG_4_10_14_0_2_um_filter_37_10]PJA92555.1 MAG: cysteine desulfurase NifS [Candidatus Komeilibacteria bacterium CG_4_9_14_3_um_filter_37_5]